MFRSGSVSWIGSSLPRIADCSVGRMHSDPSVGCACTAGEKIGVRCGFGGAGVDADARQGPTRSSFDVLLISEGTGVTCVFFIVKFCPIQGLSGAIFEELRSQACINSHHGAWAMRNWRVLSSGVSLFLQSRHSREPAGRQGKVLPTTEGRPGKRLCSIHLQWTIVLEPNT